MSVGSAKRLTVAMGAVLALLTLAVYLPATQFDFVNYDDGGYITKNPFVATGLSWDGFGWAFTHSYASNWHPLTWLSHMLDCQLFGTHAGWHHAVNVLWHTANSVLVFIVLLRMTNARWQSAFVAALFALHPLHVESVAWVSERKDVLSTFFGLLSVWAYVRHVEEARKPEGRVRAFLGISILCFACSLMSKAMWVTLPFVLLLLDYWPLCRLREKDGKSGSVFIQLVVEKIPYFVLTLASCVITFLVQQRGGSVMSMSALPLDKRIEHTVIAYATYLGKTFWPTDLIIIRPYADESLPWQLPVALATLVVISFWALRNWRRRPQLLVGWFWFLGTLVPVIGLVQVGNQSWADRYTYLPLLGIFIAVTWQIVSWMQSLRRRRVVLMAGAAVILAANAWATTQQLQFWHDSRTLFTHTLEVIPDNPFAHNGLGLALLDEGQTAAALKHFERALQLNPEYDDAMRGLGVALARQGQMGEAIAWVRRAVRINPRLSLTCGELAAWLRARGDYQGAIECYREVVTASPDRADWLNDFAWLLASCPDAKFRDGAEAVRLATRACELTRYHQPLLIGTLAAAQAENGEFEKAIRSARQAAETAEAAGQPEVAKWNLELIELYQNGHAYHEPATKPASGLQP